MENINLELYKVFYYVAANKSVTKAAELLLISQPAITQTIKKVEEQLGYKLFYRTSRGVQLTDSGKELFDHIKNSIECLNNGKRVLDNYNNENIKSLRIGGGVILLKHNALRGIEKFVKKYPDIKLEITKGITFELLNKLNNNELDLVLFNMPANINEELEVKKIEKVQDIFVVNPKCFPNLINHSFNIKKIENIPFVLQSEVSSSRKFLNFICKKQGIIINHKYELESYDLVLSFVKAGIGIGFVNKNHVLKELKKGELIEIKTDFVIPEREVYIAYSKRNANNRFINEFISMVVSK